MNAQHKTKVKIICSDEAFEKAIDNIVYHDKVKIVSKEKKIVLFKDDYVRQDFYDVIRKVDGRFNVTRV